MVNTVLLRTQETTSLLNLNVTDTTASAAEFVSQLGTGEASFVLINDIVAPTDLFSGRLPDLFSITLVPGSGVTFDENTPNVLISRSYILKGRIVVTNGISGSESVKIYIESLFNPNVFTSNYKSPQQGLVGGSVLEGEGYVSFDFRANIHVEDNILFPTNPNECF